MATMVACEVILKELYMIVLISILIVTIGGLANAMIAPSQIRAARGLLDISQAELAVRSGVGLATVRRIENASELRVTVQVLLRIQQALESAGIIFIDQDAQAGPGVR